MIALRAHALRFAALALLAIALPAMAGTDAPPTPGAVKLSFVHRFMNERMELKREQAKRIRAMARKRGQSLRPARKDEGPRPPFTAPHRAAPIVRFGGGPPTNHAVNDRTGDTGSSGQSETSIAAFGDKLVAAWNDGGGFDVGGDTQGWGISTDGGASWNDMGAPPRPPGVSGFVWTSDPVVTVNEKTGAFYYTALWAIGVSENGMGVIKGRFNGSTFAWGTPRIVRRSSSLILDKEWLVADSSSGRLHLSYTSFGSQGSQIDYQTADSNGVTWSTPKTISLLNSTERGFVQGSRPAVTADGTVYVMYYLIGIDPNDPNAVVPDYYRVAKSVDGGGSFSTPVTAATLWTNFGSGAPGFNRPVGIQFAGMAVDRGFGAHRGRLYLTFAESINWLDDITNVGAAGFVPELESNDTPGTATPFVVGQNLRGNLSSTSDFDYFAMPLVAGQHVIVMADSAAAGVVMTLRLFATDGTTRLAYTNNDPNDGPSLPLVWIFTAPTSGTYYIRVAPVPSSLTGGYRLRTGVASAGSERGRDQRDVFLTHSDDGATWSNPVRVNTSAVGYDDWLPEVAVAGDGGVYCSWFDFRDAPPATNGGESSIRLSFSQDGGDALTDQGRMNDALSPWSNSSSNIEPNQGDYQALFASETDIHSFWSDARQGNPDVYTSSLPLTATGTQVRLLRATAAPHDVQLDWQAIPADTLTARLYRSDDGGPFNYLALVVADGTGHMAYTDTTAQIDHSYRYRLGIFINGVEYFFGQANVSILSSFPLALGPAWPNPSSGGSFSVVATFSSSEPATLTLHDLTGREVHRQALNMTLGPHTIVITPPSTLRQGVYVVTLRQQDRKVSTRVTYLR